MAGTAGSPGPFIKDEPDDQYQNPNRFMGQNGFDMNHQFGGQQFGHTNGDMGAVNPSDLNMGGNFVNPQFGSHNMSSSFIMGNSNIADEELLDSLGNMDDNNQGQGGYNNFGDQNNNVQQQQNQQHMFEVNGAPISMNRQGANVSQQQQYSNTPDGAPIQSPFVHDFNYMQFQSMGGQQGFPPNMQGSSMPNGGFARNKMSSESGSFPSQQMMGNVNRSHQKNVSGQWDGTPGSSSWVDSPMASPHGGMHHPQISEVVMSGKHASLPTKVEGGGQGTGVPGFQSQEAKRRRRRESHNMVERRRRDNINERIHDLSRLVPQHRLEDERVRKALQNNGPMSPSIAASGMSPPQATSLLAGGTGRRAAGNITQGLPIEEKDKGPNKGDILNGAVGWTRDLMWLLYQKVQQEKELKTLMANMNADWPFELTEHEKRMQSELVEAVEKNGTDNFSYSRGPGSGLRVPNHTDAAGRSLDNPQAVSPHSLSPSFQSGGSGSASGGQTHSLWMNNGQAVLKEEDEYSMDLQ
ncbi:hypothetical protein BDY21DRAFT_134010 [Lineolata rhizophorae]|uniref:BHLH domain-containing protein n=1 Tax=Lineolata rhizophorae TaxID=578093 RepID=A0A6A6PAA5_9PEZI|nr:hypothetical protein BDY21DRAFT_134010 [Lineolata rhizophorae]